MAALNLRTKLILVFVLLAFAPLAAVGVVGYRSGVGAVERSLRASADERATQMRQRIERVLTAQESRLLELSKSDALREYVRDSLAARSGGAAGTNAGAGPDVPDTVRAHFGAYFKNNRDYLEAVTCLDQSGQPLFRLNWNKDANGGDVNFQTTDFVRDEVRYDARVWGLQSAGAIRSPVTEESYGAALRVTTLVVDSNAASGARPANTVVQVVSFIDPEWLVEVEADAIVED